MTQQDCTSLANGDIRFYDNYVPTLGVGDFILNFTQEFKPNTQPAIDETYGASQVFSVQGPRFTLPTADIYAQFPPNNAVGHFGQFLPQLVFAKTDLPWERDIFQVGTPSDQPPWMVLLSFVAGEKLGGSPHSSLLDPPASPSHQPNRTQVASRPAADFINPTPGTPHITTETINGQSTKVLWPDLAKEWYESDDWLGSTMTNYIDVDPTALKVLVPPYATMRYQAHARQVKATNKASEALKVSGDGWYSLLVGNRLPTSPVGSEDAPVNIVHLLSLEGYEAYFGPTPKAFPDGVDRIRMISFKGWSFASLSEGGESFRALMDGLLRSRADRSTEFKIPYDRSGTTRNEEGTYAADVLENGYVPLQFDTRLGESTFAWYRGPFSPLPVKNFISSLQQGGGEQGGGEQGGGEQGGGDHDWQPFGTASAAMIYDEKFGVFNASYAVAWETGRLLALSDGAFSTNLLNWHRTAHQLIDLIITRGEQFRLISRSFDPDDPDVAIEHEIISSLDPYAWTDSFMNYLVAEFSSQLAPRLYEGEPATPIPTFPPFVKAPSPSPSPTTIKELMTNAEIQAHIREVGGVYLDQIVDWLAERYLLMSVPFENLVPNKDMLPPESIRFFYLDTNWLDAMAEGALSIGIESSRDQLYQDLMKDLIWDRLHDAVQAVRDRALGSFAHKPDAKKVDFDHESMTGMLLNSAVVAGWPGLQVTAYFKAQPPNANGEVIPDYSSEMNILRMQRLNKNTLLVLWPAVPAIVTLNEPHEGIAFGFEDPPKSEGKYLYLRSLEDKSYGQRLCSDEQIEKGECTDYIDAGPLISQDNILDVATLIAKLKTKLGVSTIHVRDLAVELVKVSESLDLISEGAYTQ